MKDMTVPRCITLYAIYTFIVMTETHIYISIADKQNMNKLDLNILKLGERLLSLFSFWNPSYP